MSKKILVKDLPQNLLACFKKLTDDTSKKNFLIHYGYFLEMQSTFEVYLSVEEFLSLISQDGNFISKKEINRLLMSKANGGVKPAEANTNDGEQKPILPDGKKVLELSPKAIEKLGTIYADNSTKKDLQNSITALLQNIQKYTNYISENSLELVKKQNALTALEKQPQQTNHLVNELNNLNNMPEYSNVYYDPDTNMIHAVTYSKFEDDAKNKFDYGQFDIVMCLKDNHLVAHPFKDNLTNNYVNRCHPHVFEGGTICLGTGSSAIADGLAKMKICQVFTILHMILNQYNPHSYAVNVNDYKIKMDNNHYQTYYRNINGAYHHKDIKKMYFGK